MKANVLYNIGNLKYEENYPLPILNEGTVLLKVHSCGICGSDIARVFKTGTYHFPTIIGHEFSGSVVDVYNKEDKSLIGGNFSVFPLIPCKQCDNCIKGNYEMCVNYNYIGSRCNGAFAEYVAVPKWNLLPLSHNIDLECASMFEPASVAMHAIIKSKLKIGNSIAIIGPGTIGMILVQLAKIAGASKIFLK